MNTKMSTSVEQSKKLIELGIDIESSDMYWDFQQQGYVLIATELGYYHNDSEIPAWSTEALLKLLPSEFEQVGKFGKFRYTIDIRKYKFAEDVDMYQIAYGNYGSNGGSWSDMINTPERETLTDVAFDMIVWLKEHNLL